MSSLVKNKLFMEQCYLRPGSVEEALAAAVKYPSGFRYIAGGTDLLINKFQGNAQEIQCLIDLTGIRELSSVQSGGGFLKIGALVKLNELKNYPEIREQFPGLLVAAESVASPVIRRTATIGGNLLCENRCVFYNQSEWWRESVGYCLKCDGDVCIATGGKKACFSKLVSDMAPALIALGAKLEIASGKKKKAEILPLEKIYTSDGISPFQLNSPAIIKYILIPCGKQIKLVFKKLRQRDSLDFSSLTTCVSLDGNGAIKIVLGSVDPGPVITEGTVSDNRADLIRKAIKKARIVDNDVFSRKYRREMIKVFLRRSFDELLLTL